MKEAKEWVDYELLDCSNGEKLERWGKYILLRPDPQVIWNSYDLADKYAGAIDAIYHRSRQGGGSWENLRVLPKEWSVTYKDLIFHIKQMGFKHTGLFPEQAVNWEFMMHKIKTAKRPIKVLNLFAYTGAASVACLKAGASVVHVDSSAGMVNWCRENVKLNGLEDRPIRYLVDDVVKFVEREIRRGNVYDAIIMDPPSYGRGANKEVWNIEKDLMNLVEKCVKILSPHPLFFLINSYTTGLSSVTLYNILTVSLKKYPGHISHGEIGLPVKSSSLVLSCGIYGRWESDE